MSLPEYAPVGNPSTGLDAALAELRTAVADLAESQAELRAARAAAAVAGDEPLIRESDLDALLADERLRETYGLD